MLKSFINKFGTTIYVQIWENRIKLTDSKTGNIFDESPLVALKTDAKGKKSIVAIGNAASESFEENIQIINPFSHPRVLFADFNIGEQLLKYALTKVMKKKFFTPAPAVVIQPMEKTEGGLTMIEIRAFRELAFGAGARDSVIYEDHQNLYDQGMDFKAIKQQVGDQ